jgi:hypothetical protein
VADDTPIAGERARNRQLPRRIEVHAAGASRLQALAQCLERFDPDPAPEARVREVTEATVVNSRSSDGRAHLFKGRLAVSGRRDDARRLPGGHISHVHLTNVDGAASE